MKTADVRTADRRKFFFGGISEYEKEQRPDGVDKRRRICQGYLAEFAGTKVVTDAELAWGENCPPAAEVYSSM